MSQGGQSTVDLVLQRQSKREADGTLHFILLYRLPVCFRFTEKGNLEVLLFTVQSKMRANNQKVYMPREGKLISDINKVSSEEFCNLFLDYYKMQSFFLSFNNLNFKSNCFLVFLKPHDCYQVFFIICAILMLLSRFENQLPLFCSSFPLSPGVGATGEGRARA